MDAISRRWKIPITNEFRVIDNGDSIQLANPDESKVVYISILSATGKDGSPSNFSSHAETPPEFAQEGAVYHLRGTKVGEDEVLVVVITLKEKSDEAWARQFFDSIDYR
jgi:hypothetical protein